MNDNIDLSLFYGEEEETYLLPPYHKAASLVITIHLELPAIDDSTYSSDK